MNLHGWLRSCLPMVGLWLVLSGGNVCAASSSSAAASDGGDWATPPGFVACANKNEGCYFTGTRVVRGRICSVDHACYEADRVDTDRVTCVPNWFTPNFPPSYEVKCYYSKSLASGSSSSSAAPIVVTATASSQSGTSRAALYGADGKPGTRWEASNSSPGAWLQLRGVPYGFIVSRIEISEAGSHIRGYRVETQGASGWVPLAEGYLVGPKLVIDVPYSDKAFGSVIRIVTTGRATGQPSISEFRLFGQALVPIQ